MQRGVSGSTQTKHDDQRKHVFKAFLTSGKTIMFTNVHEQDRLCPVEATKRDRLESVSAKNLSVVLGICSNLPLWKLQKQLSRATIEPVANTFV